MNIENWFAENNHIWKAFEEQALLIYQRGHRHYSCLLYTSPSPRDRTRSRMPSSA